MEIRRPRNSDLVIISIGFAAWAMGGGSASGWGSRDDKESGGAIERSVNWV